MAISGSGSEFGCSGSGPGYKIFITGPALNLDFFNPGPIRVEPGKIRVFGFPILNPD